MATSHEILVLAFDSLTAQLDSKLIELHRELGSTAVAYGTCSPQVAALQARIVDTKAQREETAAELERAKVRLAASVTVTYLSTLPAEPKPARKKKEPGTTTRAELKLIDASAQIMGTPPDGEDMAFTHSVLCQVGLPRSKFEGREFMRQSGAAWINVQAGWLDEGNGPVQQPVPYGALPRLASAVDQHASRAHQGTRNPNRQQRKRVFALAWQAQRPEARGGSFSTLRQQMHAFAACRLQLGFKGRTYNGQPVEQFDAWLTNKDTGQQALWPGVLVLSEGYFRPCWKAPCHSITAPSWLLADSALALDVYAWLAHRLHRIEGRGVLLHWKSFREQFGQETTLAKTPSRHVQKGVIPVATQEGLGRLSASQGQAGYGRAAAGVGSPPPIRYKG
jgi:hypothetical protein